MHEIEIKSPEQGAYLKFQSISDEDFIVEAGNVNFWARAGVSTFQTGSPALFFNEIARDWRGWQGEKIWADLESNLHMSATVDSVGHVSIAINICDPTHESRLHLTVVLESGQLESIASQMLQVFPTALE